MRRSAAPKPQASNAAHKMSDTYAKRVVQLNGLSSSKRHPAGAMRACQRSDLNVSGLSLTAAQPRTWHCWPRSSTGLDAEHRTNKVVLWCRNLRGPSSPQGKLDADLLSAERNVMSAPFSSIHVCTCIKTMVALGTLSRTQRRNQTTACRPNLYNTPSATI